MKTERLSLLISADDKAAIAARAAALHLSSSELIRRAVSSYDPAAQDDAEVRALTAELARTVAATERALDATLERLDTLEERFDAARHEAREAAEADKRTRPFTPPPTAA